MMPPCVSEQQQMDMTAGGKPVSVRSVADANIGAIFGWGFAPHHGGTLQFINAMGLEAFITYSRELAEQYGERFQPAQLVLDMAAKGEVFSDDQCND